MLELERELMRKERQIEYLQMELRRAHNIVEELKQGMRPVGHIEEIRGEQAYVRLAGGQLFQVSVPSDLRDKVTTDVDAVLSPTKGALLEVIERPKERSIWAHKLEKAPRVYYDDIVGLKEELREFRKAVEWVLSPELRTRRSTIIKDERLLEEAGSVLLFGPPGVGKTYMAKAVAGTISKYGQSTSFVKVDSYELVSKWLGESARNVKEIFKLARDEAPSLLFFDEVDAIGRARTDVSTDAGRDVQGMLNQVLTEMGEGFHENSNVAMIFATNFPNVIDRALLDRVRTVIYIRPPKGKEEVKQLFEFYLSKVQTDPEVMGGGRLSPKLLDEVWEILRKRKQVYEAIVPGRNISVRDEYYVTPREIKNIVLETADDACFGGQGAVTGPNLIEHVNRFVQEDSRKVIWS